MSDKKIGELTESSQSQAKDVCGADCPNCIGGTCFLETGHHGLHHCNSCANTWETLHHFGSLSDL
jgi:hypothetical protein